MSRTSFDCQLSVQGHLCDMCKICLSDYSGPEWPLKVRTQIQKSNSKSNDSKLKVGY